MAGIEGGSSSSSCGTARQSLVRFQKRKHLISLYCVGFLLFKPWLIRQIYTERRRLAPEYMGSNRHTHQHTQLAIVTNIIEHDEFVATAIIYFPPYEQSGGGRGGGGALPDFAFLLYFPCSADHEQDRTPIRTLNVRNNSLDKSPSPQNIGTTCGPQRNIYFLYEPPPS